MNKLILAFGLLLLFPWVVLGADSIQFDGETYTKQFSSNKPDIRLVEYVRSNETIDHWTKLVAIRQFTKLDNPKLSATHLANALKQQNPEAKFQIFVKKDGSEAQIDFLTWSDNSQYMEFNIHRYLKVKGYDGLISYQFAYKLTDTSDQAMTQFKKNRQQWINEMSEIKFAIDFDKK